MVSMGEPSARSSLPVFPPPSTHLLADALSLPSHQANLLFALFNLLLASVDSPL